MSVPIATTPVAKLRVKYGEETFVEAQVDATGKILTFELPAKDSFKYTFRWTERDSGKGFDFEQIEDAIALARLDH